MTDYPKISLENLSLCTVLCQGRNGSHEVLKSITLNLTKIHGLEDRLCSIKVDKDADLVIRDGGPLNLNSKAVLIIIDGKMVL